MNMVHKQISTLFFLEDLCYGGSQRQMLELARRLDREQFAVQVLTLTGPTDFDQIILDSGLKLIHLGKSRRVPLLFFLQLGSCLRKLQVDVILTSTALPNIWGRIWGKILNIPVLGTVRGGGAIKRQHESILWHLAKRLVCNSPALYADLLNIGVAEERLSYIPNGIDIDYFQPANLAPSQKGKNLLCVARLVKDKDLTVLLKAFALVKAKFNEASLTLVGEGSEMATLQNLANALNIQDAVIFAGARADVRPYYEKATLFILSSKREGQPNVLLEAMASALPICATNVGGVANLIKDCGLLSPAGDANALAQNILQLLEQPNLADTLGKNGRTKAVNEFSFAAMVKAHARELQLCLPKI